jgi:DNA-binding response OmpR family regulator
MTEPDEPASRTRRVLLVEDDEAVRRLIRFNLELAGFEVIEAADGLEGLLFVDLHRPDAVILDLMMPDVDGGRVLAQMRGRPETKGLPVIIVTGKADLSPELRQLAGEGNVIPKPFDPDVLVARIQELTEP